MGIDVNDLKILINTSFQYLIKTCHQWAKDHPLVTGVLLFFYLLYLFFPNLFSILFYTFPLIICIAIILGGKHISKKQNQEHIKNNKKYDVLRSMTIDHRRRRHLTPQMRSMTLGRTEGLLSNEEVNEQNNTKLLFGDQISTSISCTALENSTLEQTSRPTSTGISSHSDTESQDEEENEDEESRKARDKVVEWTEDDQRNLMDLGSSEIERNKRLESLIAKRRARKQLSMQPRRAHYPYENLMDHVGSIMVSRCIDHDSEHQPGSAPCVLRPITNPFDLPYDPHEEKPVLTGGSFDDEFFSNEQKEMLEECLSKHDGDAFEESVAKFLPSFFIKPKSIENPGFTRFRIGSDESIQETLDEPSKEDARNDDEPNQQDSYKKVELRSGVSLSNKEDEELENPFAKDFDTSKYDSTSSSEMISKEELQTENDDNNNNKENVLHMDLEHNITPTDIQSSIQDHISMSNERDDDQEDSTSTSSSSSSTEMTINAIKNEAFRNSVKKVLTCLVIQRHKANTNQENTYDNTSTSNGLLFDSVPNITTPTKMEERSFYTNKPHHTTTFSIASDMQVEVSDTGSPPLATLDPGSPTDRESLVYDGDVDKDANSGDEDLWGASPHPIKQGDFTPKFKLPDITEESQDVKGSSLRGEDGTADERTMSSQGKEIDQDQRSIDAEIIGSMSSLSSSSSDGLMSQMQAKTEHLAEYLANLPPTESGSNALEESEPSLVREHSTEEQTLLELDEAKDDLHKIEEMIESQLRINEQGIITGEISATNETDPISRECIEGKLNNQNGPGLLAEHDLGSDKNESYSREPVSHEKELISDSLSTTCQEDIFEQSIFDERDIEKLEEDTKISNDEPRILAEHDHELEKNESYVSEPLDHEKEMIFDSFSTSCQEKIPEQSRLNERDIEKLEEDTKISNDKPKLLAEIDHGLDKTESCESEPLHHEKEVIFDSFSPTCQEEILEQSRLDERHIEKLNKEMTISNDEPRLLVEPDLGSNKIESYVSEPLGHEKEVIFDSFSTTCQEEIFQQLQKDEKDTEKLEEHMKISNHGVVEEISLDNHAIHDNSTSVEKPADDQEHHDNTLKSNEQSMIREEKLSCEIENTSQTTTIEEDKIEPYVSEPLGHEKEMISDSLLTTCQEEILKQPQEDERDTKKLEEHMKFSNHGVVEKNSLDNHAIHDNSTTSVEKRADDQQHHDNTLKPNEESMLREEKLSREIENTSQTTTIEEDNMHPLSSTELVSSTPINNPQDNLHDEHPS